MKIAIVAPSPVPFCIGGAENLWWGLQTQINQHTSHQAELIKLPSREASLAQLVQTYREFSLLDLSHFDLVITGKYPAWMIGHENHICYMLHRLRGLYDTYHFTGLPTRCDSEHPRVAKVLEFNRRHTPTRAVLPEFFALLDEALTDPSVAQDTLAFPGPFAREVVHFLDAIGLAPNAVKRHAAISATVAARSDYFPPGAPVDVIYPPSNLSGFRSGSDDYLFTVSRLDGPKRIRLLIEAMRHVKTDIALKIAGTGPDEKALKQLAAGDRRIEFLGFVNDHELIELYANALAVPYVPFDEDYGLITIEAMMSGKPVLTLTDSGGPNEFVKNGLTGFSVPPSAEALAERIDYLCSHRSECRMLGHQGRQLVSRITWENTLSQLLEAPQASKTAKPTRRKKRMTVAITFPVYPPRGGGQSRIFHLYRHLAQWWDIDLVSFGEANSRPFSGEIAPGLREIRVPKSATHDLAEREIMKELGGVPVGDVTMPLLYSETPAYIEELRRSAQAADLVVACHPYLFEALRAVSDKPLWYEAQDVEWEIKKEILPDTARGRELLALTQRIEAACTQTAELVMVCAERDGLTLAQHYGVPRQKFVEVANGVDLESVSFVDLAQRRKNKADLGVANSFSALFIGSWHGPNLEAVEYILAMAKGLPTVKFLIVGSASQAFQNRRIPENVGLMGVVDDITKDVLLSVADVALNPMQSGSGTNLKMLDYLAAGVPVISTAFGARGLDLVNERDFFVAPIDEFSSFIARMIEMPDAQIAQIVDSGRRVAMQKYDWKLVARAFHDRHPASESPRK